MLLIRLCEAVSFRSSSGRTVKEIQSLQDRINKANVILHMPLRPGQRGALNKDNEADALLDNAE